MASLASGLGVVPRTVRRDMEVLRLCGVGVGYDPSERGYILRGDWRFAVAGLTDDELLGQATAVALTSAKGLDVGEGAGPTARKLRSTGREGARTLLEDAIRVTAALDLKLADHEGHRESMRSAQLALVGGSALEGIYSSPHRRGERLLVLHPIRLCLVKQAWYLIASPEGSDRVTTYRIARFRSLRKLALRSEVPRDFDLRAYFGDAWSVYRGEVSHEVEVRFEPEAAGLVTGDDLASHPAGPPARGRVGHADLPGRWAGGGRVVGAGLDRPGRGDQAAGTAAVAREQAPASPGPQWLDAAALGRIVPRRGGRSELGRPVTLLAPATGFTYGGDDTATQEPSPMPPAIASPFADQDSNRSMAPAPDCLPRLTPEQRESLRDDIRNRGVQVAVEVCAKTGEVLDGRARVAICEELKVRNYPRKVVAGLDTEEARRHHRLRANCLRRQLGLPAVKGMVLDEMRRKSQTDRALAFVFGVSHTCIANWRRGFVAGGNLLPTESHEGRDGKTYTARRPTTMYATNASSANRSARLLNEIGDDGPGRTLSPLQAGRLAVKVRRERADASCVKLPTGVKLYEGRFQDVGGKVKPGSVDVVFVDPPYDRAWLDEGHWADLGTLASRVLKPGGLMVTYAGLSSLPEVMMALSSGGLTYHWTLATRLRMANRNYARSMVNLWKPLLLYSKGPTKLPETVRDFCEVELEPKSHHEWEQPQAEAEFYLSKLARPGSLVLDPCAGSGTTLLVARRLGMTCVRIDRDPKAIELIKERMDSPA